MAQQQAWRRSPSWLALALLLALLAAAMEHSLAAAEYDLAKSSAAEMDRDLATKKAAEDKSSAAAPAMEYDLDKSSASATEMQHDLAAKKAAKDKSSAAAAAAGQEVAAPAPAPAVEEESKSLGAKAKAGLHHMMDGLSAGKAKLECKILKSCPASDAPAAS